MSNVSKYQHHVLNILNDNKGRNLSENELRELQITIENVSTDYDDKKNIYQVSPDIIKLLISKDRQSAKEYLKTRNLTPTDFTLLNNFGTYTLECLIIYILASIFNPIMEFPSVRVSTLIEQIDKTVKYQATLLKDRNISLCPEKTKYFNKQDTNELDTNNKELDNHELGKKIKK